MNRALAAAAMALASGFSFPLPAACPQIGVSPVSLPNTSTGTSYTQTVMESGAASATYSVTSGALPPGLGLSNPTATSIDVGGTPTQLGTFTFTLTATDPNGCTGGRTYKIIVACGTITVGPATLPNGQTGTTYGQSVSAAGGTPPYTYAVTAGALPAGLVLDMSTGAILNAPTTPGSYSFTITATDANSCTGSQAYSNVLVCDPPVITPTPASLCPNVAGNSAAGPAGAMTYAWSITNGAITSATNIQTITYTAGASGTTDLHLTMTSAASCQSSATINVPINPAPSTPTITPTPATICSSSTGNSATTAVASSYAWTITNGTITSAANIQTITYTAGASGTTDLHLVVTNAQGCASPQANLSVPVAAKPDLAPAAGTLNALYHAGYGQVFTASSGTPPYAFTLSPMTPPAGLTFNPTASATTATLSGAAGTLPSTTSNGTMFTVTVTDANNCTVSQNYTLVIRPNTVADAYAGGVGNTQYVVTGYTPAPATPVVPSATTVIGNDVYPGPLTGLAVTTPPAHGAVTLKTDGTFLYTPNVGDTTASDSFGYTLTDANNVTNTATVSIGLTGLVWYVNSSGANGDGRSHSPFNALNNAQAPSLAGQTIYVHTGAATTPGALTLKANQQLIGNGVGLTIGGLSLAAATKPTITGAVALADNVTVSGLAFNPAASAITSSGIAGTSTISQSTIAATSNANAVNLATGAGTISFTNTPISKTGGTGAGLVVTGKTGGTVSFDAASTINVNAATATGVSLTSNSGGSISFSGGVTLNTSGGANPALTLTTNAGATMSFTGGLSLTTSNGKGLTASGGGTLNITGASNTIATTGTARALEILGIAGTHFGGSQTFLSINKSGAIDKGVVVNFSDGSFTIAGSGGATSGGTITGTTQRGVEFVSVAGGVNLASMTFTNATTTDGGTATECGIDLIGNNNTTCNAPIYLEQIGGATPPGAPSSLNLITVNGSSQTGINVFTARNLALTSVSVTNAGNAVNEHGVVMKNLLGTTNSIASSNFSNNHSRQLYVINTVTEAPVPTLSITSTTFSGSVDLQGALFDSYNGGNIVVNVGDDTVAGHNTFQNNFSNGLQQSLGPGSQMTINVKRNTFTNNNSAVVLQAAGVGAQASMTYTIWDNTTLTGPLSGSGALIASGFQNHVMTGDIRGNLIGNGTAGSGAVCGGGCNGITVSHSGSAAGGGGRHDVAIVGNNIRNVDALGIRALIQGTAKGNIVITGNLIQNPDGSVANAMDIEAGAGVATNTACMAVTVGGAVVPASWPSQTANAQNQILGSWDPAGSQSEIFIWNRTPGMNTVNLPGGSVPYATFVGNNNSIPDATGADVTILGTMTNAASCP